VNHHDETIRQYEERIERLKEARESAVKLAADFECYASHSSWCAVYKPGADPSVACTCGLSDLQTKLSKLEG
jgi:hypothetical protein